MRIEPLRHDSLTAESAGMLEDSHAARGLSVRCEIFLGPRGMDCCYCLYLSIATRKKVAMMRVAASMPPRKLPATFDCPPLRRR